MEKGSQVQATEGDEASNQKGHVGGTRTLGKECEEFDFRQVSFEASIAVQW